MFTLCLVSIFVIGFILGKLTNWTATNRKKKTVSSQDRYEVECAECDLEHLKDEWRTTIQTQMHFNELIIKFRSIVLSVFVGGLGVVVGLSTNNLLGHDYLTTILSLALAFWLSCIGLDFCYYQKLLYGSVDHAKKFDENEFFIKKGLFGLTQSISMEITRNESKIIILIFYLLPVIAFVILLFKLNS